MDHRVGCSASLAFCLYKTEPWASLLKNIRCGSFVPSGSTFIPSQAYLAGSPAMDSPEVKREGDSPKRRGTHEERRLPYRTENDKHGPRMLSHVAVNMRRESRQPSMPKNSARRDERSMRGEIAVPESPISQRPAEPSDNAIGQRLPVRTTKVVPSIEEAEPSPSTSSESEEESDS